MPNPEGYDEVVEALAENPRCAAVMERGRNGSTPELRRVSYGAEKVFLAGLDPSSDEAADLFLSVAIVPPLWLRPWVWVIATPFIISPLMMLRIIPWMQALEIEGIAMVVGVVMIVKSIARTGVDVAKNRLKSRSL